MNDEEKKINNLQLLQEPICRMSSTSAVFKGFSAALLAGLASATMADISIIALIIGLLPVFSFFFLDVYYFRLERKLRFRYNQIADGQRNIDYKIDTNLNKDEIKLAKAGFGQCVLSPSILLFYIPVFICVFFLIFFRIIGVI